MSIGELELRRALTQADFDRFAALSGDDNPIHVDPEFSARTRFGRTVSHGVLLVTVLRGLAERVAGGSPLLRHEVRFPAPTFAEEPMLFRVERGADGAIGFTCVREADGIVTCDGRFAPLALEGGGAGGEGVGSESTAKAQLAPSRMAPPSPAHRIHPQPNPSPLEGEGLRVGDFAESIRSYGDAEVAEYVALGGETPPKGHLPSPLVSAMFSYLLGVKLPGPGANYLKQETDFVDAARVGEGLTAGVEITRLRPEKSLVDLATTCHGADGRLVATGRALIFVGDVA